MTPLENLYPDFKDVICNDMIQDKAGNMYFANSTDLIILTPSGTVSHSSPMGDDVPGLKKLVFDNNGALWVISDHQLYKYENDVWTDYPLGSYSEFTSLAIDSKNNKWVGTYGDGVFCVNSSNTVAHHTEMSNSAMLSDYVMSIAIDENDEVYMFAYAQNINLKAGLYKFKDNDWVRMENLPYDFIFALGYSDGKHLWFGSYNWGLVCYDGKKWTTINRVNSAFERDKESHSLDISISKDKKIASALFDKGLFIGENIYGN
jgi:ligand-binding sensor domain-containing protein